MARAHIEIIRSNSLWIITERVAHNGIPWPQYRQPEMKIAIGNVLPIAPYLFWDLNFHFIFNKSFTIHWQMSWAIFRGVTIFKVKSTQRQSWLLALSKEKYKACAYRANFMSRIWVYPRNFCSPLSTGVSALGDTSGTLPRCACSALSPTPSNISIKQAISFNMESCKSEMNLKTEEQMAS